MADSKMQYKLLAKRPADLYKAFKCSSGWTKLGPDANERVLACFKRAGRGAQVLSDVEPNEGVQICIG